MRQGARGSEAPAHLQGWGGWEAGRGATPSTCPFQRTAPRPAERSLVIKRAQRPSSLQKNGVFPRKENPASGVVSVSSQRRREERLAGRVSPCTTSPSPGLSPAWSEGRAGSRVHCAVAPPSGGASEQRGSGSEAKLPPPTLMGQVLSLLGLCFGAPPSTGCRVTGA